MTKADLEVQGSIANLTQEKFEEIAKAAGKNCPVSRPFKAEINVTAKLV